MPIEQTPPRSKVHGLIITLLFALLLLSLAAVALLVATQKTAPGKMDYSEREGCLVQHRVRVEVSGIAPFRIPIGLKAP